MRSIEEIEKKLRARTRTVAAVETPEATPARIDWWLVIVAGADGTAPGLIVGALPAR